MPTTGVIGASGEVDCFTFTGAVGDTVRARVIKTSGTFDPLAEVVRPNGQTCTGTVLSDEFNCAVNSAGTHTILIRDFSPGTRTGNYSLYIQRLNNPALCTAISFGALPKTGALNVAAETDCFTFTGAVGDTVRARVIKTSGTFDPLAEVVRPNGQTCTGTVLSDEFNCAVNSAGTHTILIRDFSPGTRTGNYSLYIQRLNNPALCTAISFGALPKNGSLTVPAETDCFTFTGAVGDTVRVRVIKTSGTFDPFAEVVRPNGQTCTGTVLSDEFNCAVNSAGAHTILIRDFSPGTRTGSYSLYIQRLNTPPPPPNCTALSFGASPKNGSLTVPAETDCFTFIGAVGDTVRVRVIKTSGTFDPLAEVVRPNGQTCTGMVLSDEFNCAVNSAGTHTILIRDFSPGTRTGTYQVSITKL